MDTRRRPQYVSSDDDEEDFLSRVVASSPPPGSISPPWGSPPPVPTDPPPPPPPRRSGLRGLPPHSEGVAQLVQPARRGRFLSLPDSLRRPASASFRAAPYPVRLPRPPQPAALRRRSSPEPPTPRTAEEEADYRALREARGFGAGRGRARSPGRLTSRSGHPARLVDDADLDLWDPDSDEDEAEVPVPAWRRRFASGRTALLDVLSWPPPRRPWASMGSGDDLTGISRAIHLATLLGDGDDVDYDRALMLEQILGRVRRGVSQTQLEGISASRRLAQVDMTSLRSSQCSICISEYEIDEQVRTLPCWHLYHMECIDRWMQENRTCPICKADVVTLAQQTEEVLNGAPPAATPPSPSPPRVRLQPEDFLLPPGRSRADSSLDPNPSPMTRLRAHRSMVDELDARIRRMEDEVNSMRRPSSRPPAPARPAPPPPPPRAAATASATAATAAGRSRSPPTTSALDSARAWLESNPRRPGPPPFWEPFGPASPPAEPGSSAAPSPNPFTSEFRRRLESLRPSWWHSPTSGSWLPEPRAPPPPAGDAAPSTPLRVRFAAEGRVVHPGESMPQRRRLSPSPGLSQPDLPPPRRSAAAASSSPSSARFLSLLRSAARSGSPSPPPAPDPAAIPDPLPPLSPPRRPRASFSMLSPPSTTRLGKRRRGADEDAEEVRSPSPPRRRPRPGADAPRPARCAEDSVADRARAFPRPASTSHAAAAAAATPETAVAAPTAIFRYRPPPPPYHSAVDPLRAPPPPPPPLLRPSVAPHTPPPLPSPTSLLHHTGLRPRSGAAVVPPPPPPFSARPRPQETRLPPATLYGDEFRHLRNLHSSSPPRSWDV